MRAWRCCSPWEWRPAAVATTATATAAPARAAHRVNGDFDGDGHRDIAIGAPGGDRVRIAYTHARRNGSHVVYITGHASHPAPMYFGASLAVGDFNGDGYSDLAVGAPDYRPKHQHGGFENNPETQGAVFEYLGSATGLHQQPLAFVGPYDGDEPYNLGGALATGDADQDGYTDLAVTLFGGDNGDIRFYHGSASGLTQTGEQDLDDSFAAALDFGDVNGDGHPDLIAGSDTDFSNTHDLSYGDVKVFNGTSLGVHTNPAVSIDGQQVGVRFGLAYSSLATGDINGDGYEDVVGGNQIDRQHGTHKLTGSVIVLYGSPHGLRAIHSDRIQAVADLLAHASRATCSAMPSRSPT